MTTNPGSDDISRSERREIAAASAGDAPFGLPVLAEFPELAGLLGSLAAADRAALDALLAFRELASSGRTEEITGLGLDHWIAACTRACGLDRRMLRRICRLLDRLPALERAAEDGQITFSQLRALTLELRNLPRVCDERLDEWLAAAIEQLPDDADPDVLVRQAGKALGELYPQQLADDEASSDRRRYLALQPTLDGTGGRFHGYEDAIGFAMLEAATALRPDQLDGDHGRARANNLQAWFTHTCDPDVPASVAQTGDAPISDASEAADGLPGERLTDGRGLAPVDRRSGAPVKLIVRCELDALLDRTATPATLLTRLTGGQLQLTSSALKRVVEQRGAELRLIVTDAGEVIGLGRKSRLASEPLTEAILGLHDTCTVPLCARSALICDIDHATDWTPDAPAGPYGRTDIDNLGPLCRTTNRDIAKGGWTTTQHRAGIRTWQHTRAGLSLSTVPATWRPNGISPPPHTHPPPSARPAGDDGSTPPHQPDRDDDLPF